MAKDSVRRWWSKIRSATFTYPLPLLIVTSGHFASRLSPRQVRMSVCGREDRSGGNIEILVERCSGQELPQAFDCPQP